MHSAPLPISVNYHLNKNCNFRCKGCYATFDDDPSLRGAMLPKDDMFRIVDAVAALPLPTGKAARKLTFAGGEPTLCPWLPDLIAHAKSRGLVTMLVTNGSRCSTDYLAKLALVLDWLTVSIDSITPEINLSIGRHDSKGRPLSAEFYSRILADASDHGIRTKINTVVNRMNHREDMSPFISASGIARWKILQIMPVAGQNDFHIGELTITSAEFDGFVNRHHSVSDHGIRVVPEPIHQIRGSYCMIDPQGRFFDSSSGSHFYSDPILEAGAARAFRQVSFDQIAFNARGGEYEFLP